MLEDGHVRGQLAIFVGGEVVLHLLEFVGGNGFRLEPGQLRVDARLDFLRRAAFLRLGLGDEEAGVFAGLLGSLGLGGELRTEHQTFVESAGAGVQQSRQDFQRVGIGVAKGDGVPPDFRQRIGLRLSVHALLGDLRHFHAEHRRWILRAARDATQILLGELGGLVGVEIADEHGGEILRGVVGGVEVLRLRHADLRHVKRPADDRPVVVAGLPEERVELLLRLAQRRGFRAQPALFHHHVTLGVELPEDRPQQPLAFHPHPQLQLVRRHGDEVASHVLAGEGVHGGGPGGGVNAVELVLHHQLTLLGDELLELLVQLPPARRHVFRLEQIVRLAPADSDAQLVFLRPHLVAHLLLGGDDLLVALVVLRAEGGRALEHHVLEKVGDAGDAGALVGAADVRDPAAGDARFVVPDDEQELHAVGQFLFDDGNLLRLKR